MNTAWLKIARDAAAARGRLAIIVAALAAGITAVTTMLGAWSVLTREVPRNYLGTNPASAQLELAAGIDEALLAQVRAQANVAAAEPSAALLARIEVGKGEWLPMLLFVVPSFEGLQLNAPAPEAGAWPPPPGGLLIERSALALTRAPIGAPLHIELPQGGRREIVLAGTVHDPALAPAWQEQTVYAYATAATLRALGEPVVLDLLKIRVAQGGDDVVAIERTVRELGVWLATQGQAVHEARIPPPGRHPHQAQMNAVLAMLLVFSLMAMLLAAVLAATVIGGLLAQQVRQLAIMKAIGARSRRIATLYLGLVALLGLAAAIIGLPLGWLGARGFVTAIAGLLNLRIADPAFAPWVWAAALLLALVAPLAAAWWPVRSAARRSVNEAIADHGVSRGLRRPPGPLPRMAGAALGLAWRNTFRRRSRLGFTLALLAGAGAMFITSMNLRAAWQDSVAAAARNRHYDLELRLQQAVPSHPLLEQVATMPGVAAVEAWSIAAAAVAGSDGLDVLRSYPDGAHGGFTLRAAPPATRLVAHEMAEGRWLRSGDDAAVVINSVARTGAFRGAAVGDWVTLSVEHRSIRLRIVGFMRERLTPGAAYVLPETFDRASGRSGTVNALRVAVAGSQPVPAIAQSLQRALEARGIGVRMVITEARFAAAQGGHVYVLVYALGFIAAAMALVGLLGLASALGTAVGERMREIGVLRALGARSGLLLRSVLAEGLLIALLSVFVALGLSWALSARVAAVLAAISAQELELRLSAASVVLWLLAVLAGAAIAGWFPALRASRLSVRSCLTRE